MIWIKRKQRAFAGAAIASSLLITPFCAHAFDGTMKTDNVRSAETDAGDVVADAVRSAMNADIAFTPAAAFKVGTSTAKPAGADQVAGLIASGGDTLTLLTLRGDKIMNGLERSVSFEPQTSLGFLQISGIRFSYDAHRDPGKRVSAVTVNGQPLDASKRYKVATTKPLADGQQGYFQIWDKGDITTASAMTLDAAVKEYVKTHGGTVSPNLDGRIVAVEH